MGGKGSGGRRSGSGRPRKHPSKAYKHLMQMHGMTPNPQFVPVVEANFPKDAKIIVACAAGRRSAAAVSQLEAVGYSNLADSRAGFDGAKDGMGRTIEPGWAPAGLPVVKTSEPERTWAGLVAKLG